ncbi:MAG: aminoacyltransferase [Bacteroidales bacterium]|jgi:hypothetical protein|nr:aminoacyltransferase [Bacteroidales bacterium]
MTTAIISVSESSRWKEALASATCYDAYHTLEYHKLNEGETPVMLVFSGSKDKLFFPIVVRKIKNSCYKDAISVYGYAGLVPYKNDIKDFTKKFFYSEMVKYCNEHNIVSIFTRLHPLIPASGDFPDGMGAVEKIGQTVYLNLAQPEQAQLAQYSRSLVYQLKNSRLKVRVAHKSELDTFINMYRKTMDRLQADDFYYFSDAYFQRLMDAADFQPLILFAQYGNTVVGGALFTCCRQFMQYHLGAVPDEFLPLSPLKSLIDHARGLGCRMGLKYLHLGGGYGGREDGLFLFKSRFSHERATFKVWKWIANQPAYNDLVHEKFGENIPDTNFFPLYRLFN